MDDKEFNQRAALLEKIGQIVAKLPAEIRAQAFDALKAHITSAQMSSSGKKPSPKDNAADDGDDRTTFFAAHDNLQPNENVRLMAAYLYSQYGAEPFGVDELSTLADDVGVTVPTRIDMTLLQAKENGKKLFTRAGRGKFKPTVHGETHFKATYSVKKGTKDRPAPAE